MTQPNLGEQPRPRVLVKVSATWPGNSPSRLPGDDRRSIIHDVEALAGTCKVILSTSEVRLDEWDACLHLDPTVSSELLTAMPCFCPAASDGFPFYLHSSTVPGREIVRPDAGSDDIAHFIDLIDDTAQRLTQEDFKAVFRRDQQFPTIPTPGRNHRGGPVEQLKPVKSPWTITNLLEVPPNLGVVVLAHRSPNPLVEAIITSCEVDIPIWFEACLRRWHTLAPHKFPRRDWHEDLDWSTAYEQETRLQIRALRSAQEAAWKNHEELILDAEARLASASAEGAKGLRRLLTATGDDLVDAVLKALEQIGFEVVDRDEEQQRSGDELLEDLTVSPPEDPAWVALVQVRGKKRRASSNEMSTGFLRPTERYSAKHSKPPDAKWFVVNSERERDPAERVIPLHTSEADVASFGKSGGLLIWTVDLFRLVRAVENGAVQASDARSSLMSSVGRFCPSDS